jgi:hypothetical protein
MKLCILFGIVLGLSACGGGGSGTGEPSGSSGGGSGGGSSSSSGASSSSSGTSSSSSGASGSSSGGTYSTAAWVGTWSCTSGGTLNGAALPSSASTAVITSTGPDQLTVVATTTGSSNPACTLTATLTSDIDAAFPTGQSCNLESPVSATLTLTPNSTAQLQGTTVTTTENVSVSNSPGFDGQTGTLTGSCMRK